MGMLLLFFQKVRVWCHFPDTGWELGNVQSLSGQLANIFLSDGKVRHLLYFFNKGSILRLLFYCPNDHYFAQISTVHVERLLPANPNTLDGTDDLIQLSYLNEPSVLYSLKRRYADDMIYVCRVINRFFSFVIGFLTHLLCSLNFFCRQKQGLF